MTLEQRIKLLEELLDDAPIYEAQGGGFMIVHTEAYAWKKKLERYKRARPDSKDVEFDTVYTHDVGLGSDTIYDNEADARAALADSQTEGDPPPKVVRVDTVRTTLK